MSARRLTLTLVAILMFPALGAFATCIDDSSTLDFSGSGDCYISDVAGGEVALPATIATEFDGNALPGGWTAHEWTSGGSVSVGGGVATVFGNDVFPDPAAYGSGRSLEFVATYAIASAAPLTAQPFQTIGLASGSLPFNDLPLLAIGTFNQAGAPSQGFVNAMVWESGTPVINLHQVDGLPHRYRIDWSATTVSFWVDGVLLTTQPHGISASMRPGISNFQNGNPLVVDWIRMTPYVQPCAYESAPRDSGATATDWSTLSGTLELPAGTGVSIETRTGGTVPVDGTWSAYQLVSGGLIASPRNRYLQYRVALATSDTGQTPAVDAVQVCYDACSPSAEVCDGIDNDCDDLVDEGNPGGGVGCSTGLLGICATGLTECTGGGLVCNQLVPAGPETCNGYDDDCDGSTDEGNPGGNVACSTGQPGVCAAGTTACTGGGIQCQQNVPAGAEACDGVDNDCDGNTDEGDPGGGGVCNTGNPGICALGTAHCQSGAIACVQVTMPSAETCNGIDDNCNGSIDEGNPGGNQACATGVPGVCSAGTTQCSGATIHCNQNVMASAETCDGVDNDCDGATDEGDPGGGGACATGNPGICAAGVDHCQSGALHCVQTNTPAPSETCNGLDDNCNGSTDEGDPGGGAACTTGNPGICAAGINHCIASSVQCVQTNAPHAETCNTLDDDCDGSADEGNPGGGAACSTGQMGVCDPGTRQCISGSLVCQANQAAMPELCNNLDDNCNGNIDEGNPGGGIACSTGASGVCNAGTTACVSHAIACQANVAASTEICDTALDEDCDGNTDEEPCALCTAANTVTLDTQTKVVLVKQSSTPGQDKITAKGTLVLPAPGTINPALQPVTVKLTDGAGSYYTGTIPAGHFTSSSSIRSFKFIAGAPYPFDGMQHGIIKISGGDLVTTKYAFKARSLSLSAFVGGTGTLTIKVGDKCFQDDADTCTVSASGAKAKCR